MLEFRNHQVSTYKKGAVTYYFAELERARDQKELPYSERENIAVTIYISPL